MQTYIKLLILLKCSGVNGLFINDGFPKIRRVSEKNLIPKIYIIDIDGTICYTKNSDYYNSIPIRDNIQIFNKLYEQGNEVHYWTARGANSKRSWDEYTEQQLKKWGVKYTSINLDKPHYDVWIDDKAVNVINLNCSLRW